MKLEQILETLNLTIPPNRISTKTLKGTVIKFVSWPDIADVLDARCGLGGWSWEIVSMTELSPISQISGNLDNGESFTRNINARLIIIGKLTIYGDDRSISFSASGEELLQCSSYGDPSSNAEAMAFRRAAAKAGLGRYIWQKK